MPTPFTWFLLFLPLLKLVTPSLRPSEHWSSCTPFPTLDQITFNTDMTAPYTGTLSTPVL